jgi:hypothetical protein
VQLFWKKAWPKLLQVSDVHAPVVPLVEVLLVEVVVLVDVVPVVPLVLVELVVPVVPVVPLVLVELVEPLVLLVLELLDEVLVTSGFRQLPLLGKQPVSPLPSMVKQVSFTSQLPSEAQGEVQ